MSVNKVILVGRLGQEPELRYTSSGVPVCNLSLATSESWTDKSSGQKQEKTEWHRIVVWNKQAEFCNQYLSKGRQVYIEGQLQTRSWEDAEKNKRYTTEINARTVQFLGEGRSRQEGGQDSSSFQREAPRSEGSGDATNGMSPDNAIGGDYKVSTEANFTADDIPF